MSKTLSNEGTPPEKHEAGADYALPELGDKTSFESALEQGLRYNLDSLSLANRQALFDSHGIMIAANSLPEHMNFSSFTEKDWQRAVISDTPVLTLHVADYLHRQDIYGLDVEARSQPTAASEAKLRSLPLIHGTTTASLEAILERGEFVSNRTLIEENGQASLDQGWTNNFDRELGLDDYVFADFARPHMYHYPQDEVTIVLDPSVMDQPGAFATEKDIADCGQGGLEEYMQGVVTPEYFYEAAQKRIARSEVREISGGSGRYVYGTPETLADGVDTDKNSEGIYDFSTWEFKLPEVPASAIRRVVVRDESTFKQLQEKYGSAIEFVYEPKLEPKNLSSLEIPGRFEEEYEKLVEADFKERQTTLDALSPEEKETVVIVLPKNDSVEAATTQKISERSNPYWQSELITYGSEEELVDDIKNTSAGIGEFSGSSKYNQPVWFRPGFDGRTRVNTQSGRCAVVVFERSKQDNRVGVIREVKDINPAELLENS